MKKTLTIFFVLFVLLLIPQTQGYTVANVKLKLSLTNINSSESSDSKCVILVDTPPNGGKAQKYAVFEITTKTSFWIYERGYEQNSHEGYTELYLDEMDFIIVITSDLTGNGFQDFTLTITSYYTYHGTTYSSTTSPGDFGDSAYNDLKIAIYQLQNENGAFVFTYSDAVARYYRDNGQWSWHHGYSRSDWEGIWQYLTLYLNTGNEQVIEDMLLYFNFPKILYPSTPGGVT